MAEKDTALGQAAKAECRSIACHYDILQGRFAFEQGRVIVVKVAVKRMGGEVGEILLIQFS